MFNACQKVKDLSSALGGRFGEDVLQFRLLRFTFGTGLFSFDRETLLSVRSHETSTCMNVDLVNVAEINKFPF